MKTKDRRTFVRPIEIHRFVLIIFSLRFLSNRLDERLFLGLFDEDLSIVEHFLREFLNFVLKNQIENRSTKKKKCVRFYFLFE